MQLGGVDTADFMTEQSRALDVKKKQKSKLISRNKASQLKSNLANLL